MFSIMGSSWTVGGISLVRGAIQYFVVSRTGTPSRSPLQVANAR